MSKSKREYYVFLYIGRKGSGKTTLLFEHIDKAMKKKKTKIILVSPTAESQDLYTEKYNKYIDHFYPTLNEKVISEILEKRKKDPSHDYIVVFDDIGSERFFKQERTNLQALINNSRHYKVDLVFLVQRLTQSTVTTRENADSVNCFKLWDEDEIKLFKKTFFGLMPKEDFDKLSQAAWERPDQPYGYITLIRKGNTYRYGIDGMLFPAAGQNEQLSKPLKPDKRANNVEKFDYEKATKANKYGDNDSYITNFEYDEDSD